MARLAISLLGPFQVTLNGEQITNFESNKARALLAYLAVEVERPQPREKLAGLLWPGLPEASARSNLRHTLASLRRTIGDRQATMPLLFATRQTVQFDELGDAWVDVRALTGLLDAPIPAAGALVEAANLYRGEFLEGFSLADSPAFDEWVLLKREQISRQVLATLHHLTTLFAGRGQYDRALPYAWRQVELEPWREEGQRQLMRLLTLTGQRGAALAQYEACRYSLAAELNVEPAAETTQLYQQIRDGQLGKADRDGDEFGTGQLLAEAPSHVPSPPPSDFARKWLPWFLVALLLLAGAIFLFAGKGGFVPESLSQASTQSQLAAGQQLTDNRMLTPCEDFPLNRICVSDGRTGWITRVIEDLGFEQIGPGFSWSPDGEQFAFHAGSSMASPEQFDHKLYLINADGSGMVQITSGDAHDSGPAWSPDGRWLAFARNGELWLIRPTGDEPEWLWGEKGETQVSTAAWSPDSRRIAFLNLSLVARPTVMEVWVIDRDGANPHGVRVIEQPMAGGMLAWSPDGRQIVCHCVFPDAEIGLLFNADGTGEARPLPPHELPAAWFSNYWPQWGSAKE